MHNHTLLLCPSTLLIVACFCGSVAAADEPSGEQLYKKKCAVCHGAHGEGTEKQSDPLTGNATAAQLAKIIRRTMPADDVGSLESAEAEKIAAYIHEAFYSRAARERNKPPRIALARLTVRQYRSSVADLIGSFRGGPRWPQQRGLKGEYYKGRNFRDRVLEQIDEMVSFDFGTDGPLGDKTTPHEFSMRWNGSVIALETGEYEFIVRSEHAARLWLNDMNRPLIDAWVKSGTDTEYRASIYLIAGRAYPLRLEYTKSKQGVDDSKTNPKPPPPVKSSIALAWKPPHRAAEPVPGRNLLPVPLLESFVVTTPFPPDDRSYGWERGTTVSKEWDQATTEAAVETAGYVVAKLNVLAGTRDGAADRDAKVREFCRRFAERAFRRPLSDAQKKLFVDRQFEAAGDTEAAVKRVVLLVLKSPRFLYREVGATPDGYDVAARLAFELWDSLPDEELLQAAANGRLVSREQVAKQAERMLADPRCRAKLHEFLLTWLKVDQPHDVGKDANRFPSFNAALLSDLRTSLELFVDDVVFSDASDFRRLLLADEVYLNGRLAGFYGAEMHPAAGFQKVKLDPGKRAGVLTHPYLLSTFAYTGESSPIHRGVFLAHGVLGLALRPPPEAFQPLPADLHPTLTTRERVILQTKGTTCMTCHGVINPLGFPLENFDAVGRYREKDHDKLIDAAGAYLTKAGATQKFTGAPELAAFLAGSDEVHEAFVEQLFHHLVQQPARAYGPQTLDALRRSFAVNGFNVRKLAVEAATLSALTARTAPVP